MDLKALLAVSFIFSKHVRFALTIQIVCIALLCVLFGWRGRAWWPGTPCPEAMQASLLSGTGRDPKQHWLLGRANRSFSAPCRYKLPLRGSFFLEKKLRTLLFREKLAKLFVFRREKRVAGGGDPYEEEEVFPQGPTPRRSEKTGASRRGSRRMCRSHSNDAPPGAASQVGSGSTVPSHFTDAVHSLSGLYGEQQLMNAHRFSLSQWTGE